LKAVAAADPQFPRVVLVHQGTTEVAEALMPDIWPDVPAISDPERKLYMGFGLKRATLLELFRPKALIHGLRALCKGHLVGRPRGGDVKQMPGAFLVHEGRVIWEHSFEGGAGDLPDWSDVKGRAAAHMGS